MDIGAAEGGRSSVEEKLRPKINRHDVTIKFAEFRKLQYNTQPLKKKKSTKQEEFYANIPPEAKGNRLTKEEYLTNLEQFSPETKRALDTILELITDYSQKHDLSVTLDVVGGSIRKLEPGNVERKNPPKGPKDIDFILKFTPRNTSADVFEPENISLELEGITLQKDFETTKNDEKMKISGEDAQIVNRFPLLFQRLKAIFSQQKEDYLKINTEKSLAPGFDWDYSMLAYVGTILCQGPEGTIPFEFINYEEVMDRSNIDYVTLLKIL